MEVTTFAHENNIMVVEVKGEVDAYAAQDLEKRFMDLSSQGYHRIVVDISNMPFISSAGIRAILYAHREAVQSGGEVRLVGPTDHVRRTLEITGLFEILQVTDELQESITNW